MTLPAQNISVLVPLGQALEHVGRILFRPFQLEKWLSIGFCAWLAHLGQQGFHGTFGGGQHHGNADVQGWMQRARDYLLNNLTWIIPLAAAVALVGLALWVVLLWVSSRGKFMFLQCVARNSAEVIAPWHNFAREAASVFWFRLALVGIGITSFLVLGFGAGLCVWNIAHHGAGVGNILGLAIFGLVLIIILVVVAVVAKLTTDFVVPMVFAHGGTCPAAWEVLRGLIGANPGAFVLYLLFQFVLSVAIGGGVLALVLVTCCVAGCLLAIPYLGTVLFLPVLAFERAYSIFYLRQYGPEYDVLSLSVEPPAGQP